MVTKIQTKTQKEAVNFIGKEIYLGIDVHKKNWNISVYLGEVFYQTFHQVSDSKVLLRYLTHHFPGGSYKACYEAGFCGFSVQRELSSLEIDCIVVNPADVPQTVKGTLSKTDSVDSKRLGAALSKGFLTPIYIPEKITEADRQLIRYRKKIQRHLLSRRKSLKSALHVAGIIIPKEYDKPYFTNNFINWIKNLVMEEYSLKATLDMIVEDIVYFRKRLLEVNKQIRQLSNNERYAFMYGILTSVPGIGLITAMTILTEIGNIKRFSSFAKFNSFIGFHPSEFSSGENIHKGSITPRGHSAIRPLIVEAAWIAIRNDPAMALKFHELILTGKTKKRAIIVIARKLLSRIYSIWTNNKTYEKGVLK